MAAGDIRNWFARVLRSKLSTCVIVLFAAALILPWGAYASLTISERSEQIERTKHSLAALATAYGEHATTLMRLGIVIPTDEPISKSPVPDSEAQGEKEIVAFRESLNAPGVRFSLR